MKVSVLDWQNRVKLTDKTGMTVHFELTGTMRVQTILAKLGDGSPGTQMRFETPYDGRTVRGVAIKPTKLGVWNLTIQAWDDGGCSNTTGTVRQVTVVP